jgi:hypothetical protein
MDGVLLDPLAWYAIVAADLRADLSYALAVLNPLPDTCPNSIGRVNNPFGSVKKYGAVLA